MKTLQEQPAMSPNSFSDKPRILYLSLDGVLEPLGRSQVLNYLYPLSARDFDYTLISLERERDLSDASSVEEVRRETLARGIEWLSFPYRASGRPTDILKNCLTVFLAARKTIKGDNVKLIHARSYVSATVGYALRKLYSVPYLFDVRGYWVDELADEGRWFNHPITYKIGKFIEKKLLQDSVAIVTLTELHAADLRGGVLKEFSAKQIVTIPTCADYEEFSPHPQVRRAAVPDAIRAGVEGKLTVGLVGSINSSYCLRESLFLFRCLLDRREDAHLLCLTRQTGEMEALLRTAKIPAAAYTVATARHQEMNEWMGLMEWALLLLNTKPSKRGSVPTKLAEFFASGVRVIQYGCNQEVAEKVRETGSGIVLDGLSEAELREAAATVAAAPPLAHAEALRVRESTRPYFSIEAGVGRYEKLLQRLIGESGA